MKNNSSDKLRIKKAVLLINDTTYAFNLRGAIIEKLIDEGFEVVIAGQLLEHQDELKSIGAKLIRVETGRHGTNPFSDMLLMWTYKKILKMENPDIVLTYNIKPNVYGGMACQLLKIPYLPNVTGLGIPVENPGKLQKLTIQLYKMGVAGGACVFFQNNDNRTFFEQHHMLKANARTRVLPGSGVDLKTHPVLAWPEDGMVHFLFAARVMKEKGIDLYLEAAKYIRSKYPQTVFHICGGCDDEKYRELLNKYEADGTVVYHGEQGDMRPWFERCACLVHPSYYPEGMSNVLLEAAACGRPVIATERAGCRETVDDGVSGFVIPIKDQKALNCALDKVLAMNWEERRLMGLEGRRKMEKEFDRELVVDAYLEEIGCALSVSKD